MSLKQLVAFISVAAKELFHRSNKKNEKRVLTPLEQRPIDKLDICQRARVGLKRLGFNTVAELMKVT